MPPPPRWAAGHILATQLVALHNTAVHVRHLELGGIYDDSGLCGWCKVRRFIKSLIKGLQPSIWSPAGVIIGILQRPSHLTPPRSN